MVISSPARYQSTRITHPAAMVSSVSVTLRLPPAPSPRVKIASQASVSNLRQGPSRTSAKSTTTSTLRTSPMSGPPKRLLSSRTKRPRKRSPRLLLSPRLSSGRLSKPSARLAHSTATRTVLVLSPSSATAPKILPTVSTDPDARPRL